MNFAYLANQDKLHEPCKFVRAQIHFQLVAYRTFRQMPKQEHDRSIEDLSGRKAKQVAHHQHHENIVQLYYVDPQM